MNTFKSVLDLSREELVGELQVCRDLLAKHGELNEIERSELKYQMLEINEELEQRELTPELKVCPMCKNTFLSYGDDICMDCHDHGKVVEFNWEGYYEDL